MVGILWTKLKLFFHFFVFPFVGKKRIEPFAFKREIFNNLHSFTIGKFSNSPQNKMHNLDKAIRQKQNCLIEKLELKSFKNFLEVEAECGLLSCSFASSLEIIPTVVISDKECYKEMHLLKDIFLEYSNLSIHSQWRELDCNFDAVYVSNTFLESCSYLELISFLEKCYSKVNPNGRMFMEFYSCSKCSNEFVDYALSTLQLHQRTSILQFFPIKFLMHLIQQSGFELELMENVSQDAIATFECYLRNIYTNSKQQSNQDAANKHELEMMKFYYKQKITLLESGSLLAWNLLLIKKE